MPILCNLSSETPAHADFRPPEAGCSDKRILSVCHLTPNDSWAGAEVQVATLLQELSRLGELSLCAVVLGEGRLADELRRYQIETKVVARPAGRFLSCYREATEFLRDRKVDVIHSHKSKGNVLATLVAKRLGIPYMVRTEHGWPDLRTRKDRLGYWLERITATYANRIICVSEATRSQLRDRFPTHDLEVVHNSVDFVQVRSDLTAAGAKARLNIGPNVPVVGITARLVPVKRIDLFLAAARHINTEIPRTVFLVAGVGEEEASLRKAIHDTNIEARVRFLGHRDDIYDIMRAMDVLLITSDHEGLPTALLEAMALGIPTVSRNVGGIGEAICDGVNGILVSSADPAVLAQACLHLLTNRCLRQRLAAAGLESAKRFSSEQNAARIVQIYRALMSQ